MILKRKELFTIAAAAYHKMSQNPADYDKTMLICKELIKFIFDGENHSPEDEIIIEEVPF